MDSAFCWESSLSSSSSPSRSLVAPQYGCTKGNMDRMVEPGHPQLLNPNTAIGIKTMASSLIVQEIMRNTQEDQCVPNIQGAPMTTDNSNQPQRLQEKEPKQPSSEQTLIEMEDESPPTRRLRPWDSDQEDYEEDPIAHQRRGRERHRSPALSRAIRKNYRSQQKKDIAQMLIERFRNVSSPDRLRDIQEDVALTCEDKELTAFGNQLDSIILKPNIKGSMTATAPEAQESGEPKQIGCLGLAGPIKQQDHTNYQ